MKLRNTSHSSKESLKLLRTIKDVKPCCCSDPDRAYQQLLDEINLLEREPQWVPAAWLRKEQTHSFYWAPSTLDPPHPFSTLLLLKSTETTNPQSLRSSSPSHLFVGFELLFSIQPVSSATAVNYQLANEHLEMLCTRWWLLIVTPAIRQKHWYIPPLCQTSSTHIRKTLVRLSSPCQIISLIWETISTTTTAVYFLRRT